MNKSSEEIAGVLKTHLVPKRLVIGERFRFYKRDQLPNENISDYVAELKRLTTHCQFGKSLDSMLRDRFVCGVSAE